MSITAHCLVKNEEVFIEAAIRSILDLVEQVIVFDTGSTDATVPIIKKLQTEFTNKIVFEEKGPCDKKMHTVLRQEMIARTTTDWFLILDGDEVWSKKGTEEVREVIAKNSTVECIMAPFYLCVGDIFHRYYKKGKIQMLGVTDFFYPRVLKKANGIHWRGDYNEDTLVNSKEEIFFNKGNSIILKSRFWHLTHLKRSSADNTDYSSGGTRAAKRKETYFIIGKKIFEPIPDVLCYFPRLSYYKSFINFLKLLVR